MDLSAGAALAVGDAGVMGAFCANAGAEIANTAAIAMPFKRCFMFFVLCGSSGFDICGNGVLYPWETLESLSGGNNPLVVSFRWARNCSGCVSDPAGAE